MRGRTLAAAGFLALQTVAAAQPQAASAADPPRVTLTWTARQESTVYGYLVYRSRKREGPFRRVSPKVIRSTGGPEASRYEWVDDGVTPGETYFYYVEALDHGARRHPLTGVVSKTVAPAPPAVPSG